MIFEVSFEVANKVGGIYAVLSSKAAQMVQHYGNDYCTIGYYDANAAKTEFEETANESFAGVFTALEKEGVKCRFGRWMVPGYPNCILVDASGLKPHANEIKRKLWDDYKIDSLRADAWFDDPLVWSWGCGMLLEKIHNIQKTKKPVAHFHEWLAGIAMLYVKKAGAHYATVFTTHATMLGRTLANFEGDIHEEIRDGIAARKTVDLKKAYDCGMESKHLTEVACAKNCDVLTVVSDNLAEEAQYILGRHPDIVLPNGLDMSRFASMETLSYLHKRYKDKIIEFLQGYFEPYYAINTEDPRIIFTSGRYEFKNKGYDTMIDALAKLNTRLKNEGSKNDVFAFIFVPSDINGENLDVLKNISMFHTIEDYVTEILPHVKEKIIHSLISGNFDRTMEECNILDSAEASDMKKLSIAFRTKGGQCPPLSAFQLKYPEEDDAILKSLRAQGLLNRKEDRVKVIFYPTYISKADRLLALDYFTLMIGCSIGVFPSYYESWGYTPLETAASGTISITTDAAGYGQFIREKNKGPESGIFVLSRLHKSIPECVEELNQLLYKLVNMSKEEIIFQKNRAKELSGLADWKTLAKNYFKAHDMAIGRHS
ncbi:MAG: glycogen/starch synthase [Nanoarchaeota archaeon]|nr:glycogen/starch synthase [Nanoarchaeota archaeon]MCG2723641.1 glycogen/starch synthase [archaeon]